MKFIKIIFLVIIPITVSLSQTITIKSGTTVSSGSSSISLPGNWINNGTFSSGTGKVTFNGIAGNQTITNPSGETFNNITVNKIAGDVQLLNDITLNGTLTLTNGDLDMNGKTITLGSSALVSETPGNTIKGLGNVTGTISLNAPSAVNPFGLGATITSSENLGATTVTRGNSVQTYTSSTSILRYFDITPTNNSGLNATLVFAYDESELNGKTESDLSLFRSTDNGSTWATMGGTVNTTSNTVTLNNIDGFSRWTLGGASAPLPVELSTFTAESNRLNATLKWKTVTEKDNYGFEVERKRSQETVVRSQLPIGNRQYAVGNQSQWENVGFVKGSGNLNSTKSYDFTDKNLSAGKYIYRLKQIDIDGTFKYSNEIEIEVGAAPLEFNLAQNYPNPFNPETVIEFTVPENGQASLKIYNTLGEEIATLFNQYTEAGKYNQVKFNGSNHASGVYIARLQFDDPASGKVKQMTKKMLMIK